MAMGYRLGKSIHRIRLPHSPNKMESLGAQLMKVLTIDIGGTNIKSSPRDRRSRARFPPVQLCRPD